MNGVVYLILIILMSTGCIRAQGRDLTREPGNVGEFVVDATIARLDQYSADSSIIIWSRGVDSSFFKQLALVESNYGTRFSTAENMLQGTGGIWQVQEDDFLATKNGALSTILFIQTNLESQICSLIGEPWSNILYSDLEQSLISLIAARLVLYQKSQITEIAPICSSVPMEKGDYANYWFQCYRDNERGSLADFTLPEGNYI